MGGGLAIRRAGTLAGEKLYRVTRKKILVLVDWFAPGYKAGGPIQSCVNFAFAMKNEFDVSILTTDTDHGETVPYPGIPTGRWLSNLHPDFKVNYLRKAGLNRRMLKKELMSSEADFVYLNQMFSPLFVVYPLWLKYRGLLKSKVVLCPRGALYDSALSVKPWKKTPFLKLLRTMGLHKKIVFHATNDREKEAIQRFFPGSEIVIADNLPNSNQSEFSPVVKQKGKLKLIFVARIVPIKNLLFILEALGSVRANIELTIVGPVEDKHYWEACSQAIEQLPGNIQVDYIGPIRNQDLTPILHQHHLFILPTTGENFGHSIFEALLAGRPVLISDQTPWLRLSERQIGWDLPLHDQAGFIRSIEEAADWGQPRFDQKAMAAWQFANDFIHNPDLQRQYHNLFI
jgi:glycosyltransferase involved in cell wall biosynthesis